MSALPLPENELPGLAPLLNGDLWARWSSEGRVCPVDEVPAAVRYVRLKPLHSCRLTVFGAAPGDHENPPDVFLVLLFPDAERAEQAFAKVETRVLFTGHAGYVPFVSEDPPAVVLPFPNDLDLPALRHVYQPDRFRRSLAELIDGYSPDDWRIKRRSLSTELLAYKPGRRAVYEIRFELRHRRDGHRIAKRLHTKIEAAETAAVSHEKLARIHEAAAAGAGPRGTGPRVAAPAGFLPDRALTATEWCEGVRLDELLPDGSSEGLGALEATGESIAALHQLSLDLDHLPSPIEQGDQLAQLATDYAALLPAHADEIHALARRVAEAVARLSVAPSAIIHGDLHPGQVMVDATGPVLVDFDRAGRGYAADDLGSFLSNLIERDAPGAQREAFLGGYRSEAKSTIDDSLLDIATAAALFRRAVFPFRELETDWPERMVGYFDRVQELLERTPV